MVLRTAGAIADDLAPQLADSRGLPLIALGEPLSGNDGEAAWVLEQELKRQHPETGFVMRDSPATPEQAAALDSLLDALNAPLELVIGIDTGHETPANGAGEPHPDTDPLSAYYRECGLLRRIRGEGESGDIFAAAGRIIDDLARAQRSAGEDAFATALQAIVREAPPAATADTIAAPEEQGGEVTEPETIAEAAPPTPRWKRSAAQKGRLRRQTTSGKVGKKPRR